MGRPGEKMSMDGLLENISKKLKGTRFAFPSRSAVEAGATLNIKMSSGIPAA
jgi:hypothetical protein